MHLSPLKESEAGQDENDNAERYSDGYADLCAVLDGKKVADEEGMWEEY
jgi:hypothetical protein